MLKLFANNMNLQPQFIANLLLVVFESFLPFIYKFGMICTFGYRCFYICTDWTKLHTELTSLKIVFCKNGYPKKVIDKWFKEFLDNTQHSVLPNVMKDPLLIVKVILRRWSVKTLILSSLRH